MHYFCRAWWLTLTRQIFCRFVCHHSNFIYYLLFMRVVLVCVCVRARVCIVHVCVHVFIDINLPAYNRRVTCLSDWQPSYQSLLFTSSIRASSCYFAPDSQGSAAKYCDERVCLSVCLSVSLCLSVKTCIPLNRDGQNSFKKYFEYTD